MRYKRLAFLLDFQQQLVVFTKYYGINQMTDNYFEMNFNATKGFSENEF